MESENRGPRIDRLIGRLVLWRVRAIRVTGRFLAQHRLATAVFGVIVTVVGSVRLASMAQPWAQLYLSDEKTQGALSTLLVGLGCSLVGATALVFTLILFAMQVNVGRMPSALFIRLSQDSQLLAAFIGTLALSIGVAVLSIPSNPSFSVWLILAAAWATSAAVSIFLLSYKRAIALINPAEQVSMVATEAAKDLRRWARLADRVTPLLGTTPPDAALLDGRRIAFFNANPGWDQKAKSLAAQILSYGSRLAEQGDHESFRLTLQCAVSIHAAYVEVKRAAFVNSHPFMDIPESRDSFLLSTLEQLRITCEGAAARKDEQLCMYCFRAFTDIFRLYVSIQYSGLSSHKHHADLVSGYLQSQVQATVPHNMPDVVMDGVRQVGAVAKQYLAAALDSDASTPIAKIGLLSAAGAINKAHLPITQTAMEQLSELTRLAIYSERPHECDSLEALRSAAFGGASNLVQTVEEMSVINSVHRGYLAPYFSTSDSSALLPKLGEMVNAVLQQQLDGREQQVVAGFADWSDGLNRELKELLLLSFRMKSSLAHDTVNWSVMVVEMLLALRQFEHCDERMSERLHDNARSIAAVLSWVPVDGDSVHTAEACSLKDKLFEMAVTAKERESDEIYLSAKKYLLRWGVSAGGQVLGWGTLEETLKLLAGLSLHFETGEEASLIEQLRRELGRTENVSREILERAASELRREALEYRGNGHALRASDALLQRLDQPALSQMLNALADELSAA